MLINILEGKNKLAFALILIGIVLVLLGAPLTRPRPIAIVPMHVPPESSSSEPFEIIGWLLMVVGVLFILMGIFMITKIT